MTETSQTVVIIDLPIWPRLLKILRSTQRRIFFDGVHCDAVNKKVREDLNDIIIPSKEADVPIAPNFFLEARSCDEPLVVAEWQSILNGAHGAHIMHALQNYSINKEPVYNGNAYAFTAILNYRSLRLYTHHITPPTKPGERPGYHTTLLKCYEPVGNGNYSAAMGALKNLRERARDLRDRFVDIANERSRCQNTKDEGMRDDDGTEEGGNFSMDGDDHQYEGSSPLKFYDAQMFAEPNEYTQDS